MATNSLTAWVSGTDYKKLSVTPPSTSISFSIHVKPHANPSTYYYIMTLYNGVTSKLIRMRINTGRLLELESWDGGTVRTSTVSTAMTADAWNHCAGVWRVSGGNIVSTLAYMNGIAGTEDTNSVSLVSGGDFWLGGTLENRTIGGQDGTCKLGYAAVYGMELSSTDITNLRTQYPDSVQASSLKSYWIFDTNTNIADQASNGWTLTLVGTASTLDSDLPTLTAGGGGGSRGATSKGMFRSFYKGVW